MYFEKRRLADGKEQVGNTVSATDHIGKKLINGLSSHERLSALSAARRYVKRARNVPTGESESETREIGQAVTTRVKAATRKGASPFGCSLPKRAVFELAQRVFA